MKRLTFFLLVTTLSAFAQQGLKSTTFTTVTTGPTIRLIGSGISWHILTWNTVGAPASCLLQVDTSVDGSNWTLGGAIGSQICTVSGVSSASFVTANYVRVNVTALTAGASVTAVWTGYVNAPAGAATYMSAIPPAPMVRAGDTNTAANQAWAFDVWNPLPTKIRRVKTRQSSAVVGQVSLGIYNASKQLLVSTGAVQAPNSGVAIEVGVPPTIIPAGLLSLAMSSNATLSWASAASTIGDTSGGWLLGSGAFPLPSSITGAIPTSPGFAMNFLPDDPTPLAASPAYARVYTNHIVVGKNGATIYATSTTTGHWESSTDGTTWTDLTFSPTSAPPVGVGETIGGLIFHGANMFAATNTGKIWRATAGTFNAWTDVSIPVGTGIGQLPAGTTYRSDNLVSNGTYLYYGNYNADVATKFTGTPATLVVTMGAGVVTGITCASCGTGYTGPVTIFINSNCSAQPTATATVAAGVIQSPLTVTANGTSGCTTATASVKDSTAANSGAHIYRSTDGTSWTEVLTVPDGRHVHTIQPDPNSLTGIWVNIGDAPYKKIGIWYSGTSGQGGTFNQLAGNLYGIDIVIPSPAISGVPNRVIMEGDGLHTPQIMQYYLSNSGVAAGTGLIDGLVYSDTTDPKGAWYGTTRGIYITSNNNLFWMTTTENGTVGSRAGIWIAKGPWYTTPVLLEETTGAEPGAILHTYELNGYLFNWRYRITMPKFAGQ